MTRPADEPDGAARRSGDDAINQAAERARETADRNLPEWGELPLPHDTANLRQGADLHSGLLALLPMVG
ncbi:FABP family protein, partial [Streptomyces sp. SID10244]|nr:FABP family protein [Streptomyces sp. SID10244]